MQGLQTLTRVDLTAYEVFCLLLFVWLQKKRNITVKISELVIMDVLSVGVLCFFFTIVSMFFMYTFDYEVVTGIDSNVYEVADEAVPIEDKNNCIVLKEDYYTSTMGIVCCSIYMENDKAVEVDDIIVPDKFCEFVEVIRDEAAENKYNVVISGIVADIGDYKVKVRNTNCSFTVHITDVLSDRIAMTCAYSAAEINAGDTISLLLEYQGLDITNSTAQMQYSDEMVLLRNCVGVVTGIQRENNTVCVTIDNIGILDKNQEATIEIAAGTMVDSMGMMVNGAVVPITVMES